MGALVNGVEPRGFEKVARYTEFKGLRVHPDEEFAMTKNMIER